MRPMSADERKDIQGVIDELTRLKAEYLGLHRICGKDRADIELMPLIRRQTRQLRWYLIKGRQHGIDVMTGIREIGFPPVFRLARNREPSRVFRPGSKSRAARIISMIRDWSIVEV